MIDEEPHLDRRDWAEEAKGMLRAELKRRSMTYKDMADALVAVGVKETEANLRNKISRGNFSAAFFLQSLDAIGCTLAPVPMGMTTIRGRARISPARWRDSKKAFQDKDGE